MFDDLATRLLPIASPRHPVDPAASTRRLAAVAAILRPSVAGDLELLLIRRADRAGDVWSGHLALLGGRQEEADADLVETAVRETGEEVGVDLTAPGAQLLGALPPLAPMNAALPPITVHPFVWSVGPDAVAGTSDEVAATHWVSIDHLVDVDNHVEHQPSTLGPGAAAHVFPGVRIADAVLWGMTHRIVHTLLDALRRTASTDPAAGVTQEGRT